MDRMHSGGTLKEGSQTQEQTPAYYEQPIFEGLHLKRRLLRPSSSSSSSRHQEQEPNAANR